MQLKTEIICICGKELSNLDLKELMTKDQLDDLEKRRLQKVINEWTV